MAFVWSGPSQLYPVGPSPWSGNPVAILPAGTWFTPDTFPSAEDLNYVIWALTQDIHNLQPNEVVYTPIGSPHTVILPATCNMILVDGIGGGGGGGGGSAGYQNSAPNAIQALGGGGGGASRRRAFMMEVTPGSSIDVYTGTGGAGGAGGATAGAAGAQGGDGTASYITPHAVPGTILAQWPGGGGGGGGGRRALGAFISADSRQAVTPGGTQIAQRGTRDSYNPPWDLIGVFQLTGAGGTLGGAAWSSTTLTSTSAVLLTSTTLDPFTSLGYSPTFSPTDLLDIEYTVSIAIDNSTATSCFLGLAAILGGGTPVVWAPGEQRLDAETTGQQHIHSVTFRIRDFAANLSGATGQILLAISGALMTGAANTNVNLYGPVLCTIRQFRSRESDNPVPVMWPGDGGASVAQGATFTGTSYSGAPDGCPGGVFGIKGSGLGGGAGGGGGGGSGFDKGGDGGAGGHGTNFGAGSNGVNGATPNTVTGAGGGGGGAGGQGSSSVGAGGAGGAGSDGLVKITFFVTNL